MSKGDQLCSFEGCDRPCHYSDLCRGHRRQQRLGQELRPIREPQKGKVCSFEGCDKPRKVKRLCVGHRRQQVKGQELKPLRKVEKGKLCAFEGCDQLARAKGLCHAHRRQQRLGQELRPRRHWGKGHTTHTGYRVISLGTGSRAFEHRLVMEEMLGRPLIEGENVHHINGDRTDNRPENLELWSFNQPYGQRVSDKIAWAKEILALYEPTKTPKPKRKPRK